MNDDNKLLSIKKTNNQYFDVNIKSKNIKREYNIGIGLLRIILSFMVVIDHFYNKNKLKKYHSFLYYHIPSFYLLLFYFTYKTLISFNIPKIKLRLERIIIPYFSWCILSWIIKNIYSYTFYLTFRYSLKDCIFNLMHGHLVNVVLWFQNILILSTFTFLIIIFIFKNNYILILIILLIISYILQYSGLNRKFFYKYSTVHFRLTYGRFIEAIPNAVTGFIFASFQI